MKFKKEEIILSVFVILASLGAYLYLFVFADRSIVFLYGHMGLKPFDDMTTGRYWMAGFIVSGFLTLLYLAICVFFMLVNKHVKINTGTVVIFVATLAVPGILSITMATGEPKMPFRIAVSSAFALVSGIAIGFSVVDDWMADFKSSLICLFSGLGLVPLLLLFRILELPQKGLVTRSISVWATAGLIAGGFVWLAATFRLFRKSRPTPVLVLKNALATGYIGLPLVHYLFFTPENIPYITASDNFFADNLILRLCNWLALIAVVFLAEKTMRQKFAG